MWIYLAVSSVALILFVVADYRDDLQHMVWWGVISILNYIAFKAEEVKEDIGH